MIGWIQILNKNGKLLSQVKLGKFTLWVRLPFSGSNIARTVAQAAANYNSAYSSLVMAQINSKLIELAIKGGLSGLQFGLKQLIGYGLNQIWWG